MDVVGLVHRENAVYGVSFPDLLGCVSAADSYAEMLKMGAEALTFHLEAMVEDGDPIPVFRSLPELENAPHVEALFAGSECAAIFSVQLDGHGVCVRVEADHVPLTRRHDAAV